MPIPHPSSFAKAIIPNQLYLNLKKLPYAKDFFRDEVASIRKGDLHFEGDSFDFTANTHRIVFGYDFSDFSKYYPSTPIGTFPGMTIEYINNKDPQEPDQIHFWHYLYLESGVWFHEGTADIFLSGKIKERFENMVTLPSKQDSSRRESPFHALEQDPFYKQYGFVDNYGRKDGREGVEAICDSTSVQPLKEAIETLIRSQEFQIGLKKTLSLGYFHQAEPTSYASILPTQPISHTHSQGSSNFIGDPLLSIALLYVIGRNTIGRSRS